MNDILDTRFLKPDEVAAALRVSKMTVYRALHSGELFSVRVGRGFRIPEAAFEDYLQSLGLSTRRQEPTE